MGIARKNQFRFVFAINVLGKSQCKRQSTIASGQKKLCMITRFWRTLDRNFSFAVSCPMIDLKNIRLKVLLLQ